jgi:hypothetical protein
MATPIPPGFAQVLVPFAHTGLARKAAVTFGIDLAGDPPLTGSTLPEKLLGNLSANLAGAIDTSVTVGPIVVRVGQDGGDPVVLLGVTTFVGTSSSEKVCSNVALLVRKRTAAGGRRNRGRYYWPWMLSDSAVDEIGQISGGDVTGLQAAHSAFLTAVGATSGSVPGTPMVILHSTSGLSVPAAPTAVTSVVIDPVVATQRRRLVRS